MMPPEYQTILTLINTGGPSTLFFLLALAFWRRVIVPAWVVEDLIKYNLERDGVWRERYTEALTENKELKIENKQLRDIVASGAQATEELKILTNNVDEILSLTRFGPSQSTPEVPVTRPPRKRV
jgi:hypothetical protein